MPLPPPYLSPPTTHRPLSPSMPMSHRSAGSSSAVAEVLACARNKDVPLLFARSGLADTDAPKKVRAYLEELHSSQLIARAGSQCIGQYSRFEDPVRADKPRVLHFALDCPRVNWPNSAFYDVTIRDCLFAGANLQNLLLKNVDFSGSDFSGANLSGAKLKYVGLLRCDFSGGDLTGLHCDRVDFSGAILINARISLSKECIEASLRAPITRAHDLGRGGCVPEKGIWGLLQSIHSIDYQVQKNALMRSLIDHLHRLDDVALHRHLAQLVAVLLKYPGYVEEPGVARFTERLLVLWLERKQQESLHHEEVDPALVLRLVHSHPSGAVTLAKAYWKTLVLHGRSALSGAQTVSLRMPAITVETARN